MFLLLVLQGATKLGSSTFIGANTHGLCVRDSIYGILCYLVDFGDALGQDTGVTVSSDRCVPKERPLADLRSRFVENKEAGQRNEL